MSKVQTVSYKCSTGRDGFFSESLEIALDTSDNANFLSADAVAQANTLADELRQLTKAKMDEWANGVRTSAQPEPTTYHKRGTVRDDQLKKLGGFTRPWAQRVIGEFLADEGVQDVTELNAEPAQVLIDELFARVKKFKADKEASSNARTLS